MLHIFVLKFRKLWWVQGQARPGQGKFQDSGQIWCDGLRREAVNLKMPSSLCTLWLQVLQAFLLKAHSKAVLHSNNFRPQVTACSGLRSCPRRILIVWCFSLALSFLKYPPAPPPPLPPLSALPSWTPFLRSILLFPIYIPYSINFSLSIFALLFYSLVRFPPASPLI